MNCVHPGWGFVLRSYAQMHLSQPFAVWMNYFYSTIPDNAWSSPSDPGCPAESQ
jgi:hypothetical protein